jgi:hypothetical protein
MSNEEEETHVQLNQQVIREYLLAQFVGFQLTQDKPDRPFFHWFTVTNIKSADQYRLKVPWPQLSDRGNTPEKNKRRLVMEDVANQMRAAKGQYFTWGW